MVEIFGQYPIGFPSVVTHKIHVTRKGFNKVHKNHRLNLIRCVWTSQTPIFYCTMGYSVIIRLDSHQSSRTRFMLQRRNFQWGYLIKNCKICHQKICAWVKTVESGDSVYMTAQIHNSNQSNKYKYAVLLFYKLRENPCPILQ